MDASMSKQKGFTLIEILMVVAILGILVPGISLTHPQPTLIERRVGI